MSAPTQAQLHECFASGAPCSNCGHSMFCHGPCNGRARCVDHLGDCHHCLCDVSGVHEPRAHVVVEEV